MSQTLTLAGEVYRKLAQGAAERGMTIGSLLAVVSESVALPESATEADRRRSARIETLLERSRAGRLSAEDRARLREPALTVLEHGNLAHLVDALAPRCRARRAPEVVDEHGFVWHAERAQASYRRFKEMLEEKLRDPASTAEERAAAEAQLETLERRREVFAASVTVTGSRVVLGQRPVQTDLLAKQARTYFEQGQYSRALQAGRTATDLLDAQTERYRDFAGIANAQAGPPAAADLARIFARAVELQKAGKLAEAIPEYQRLLALQPRNVEARSNLGAAFAAVGFVVYFVCALIQDGKDAQARREYLSTRQDWSAHAECEVGKMLAWLALTKTRQLQVVGYTHDLGFRVISERNILPRTILDARIHREERVETFQREMTMPVAVNARYRKMRLAGSGAAPCGPHRLPPGRAPRRRDGIARARAFWSRLARSAKIRRRPPRVTGRDPWSSPANAAPCGDTRAAPSRTCPRSPSDSPPVTRARASGRRRSRPCACRSRARPGRRTRRGQPGPWSLDHLFRPDGLPTGLRALLPSQCSVWRCRPSG